MKIFTRPITTTAVLAAVCLSGTLGTALAVDGGAPSASMSAKKKAKKKGKPARRLAPPRLQSPAADATVDAFPTFTWAKKAGAAGYEFQLAADSAFESIVEKGSFLTRNTAATVNKTYANATYYWRVRAIDKNKKAGRWTRTRALRKSWTAAPQLVAPAPDTVVRYPSEPLVLEWTRAPRAYKYLVNIATDPRMSSSVLGKEPVKTSGTTLALPRALAPGQRYYWSVTPLDGQEHRGAPSDVWSFQLEWPSGTTARFADLDPDPFIFDPHFSWDPVAGAAHYEVEVNRSADWASGGRVCCGETILGTSFSPRSVLPNNDFFYWRIRAFDVDGNAGAWTSGPSFLKSVAPVTPTVPNLRLRDNSYNEVGNSNLGPSGAPTTSVPVVTWDPVPGASSYEVNVAPYEPGPGGSDGVCNWTSSTGGDLWNSRTASTAWTPLAPRASPARPIGRVDPITAADGLRKLHDMGEYCVRVRARSNRDQYHREVVSDWTYLRPFGSRAAFRYESAVPAPSLIPRAMDVGDYWGPGQDETVDRMPLFRWNAIPDASSYWVVVASDAEFTRIEDIALTNIPAYAPRKSTEAKTYSEENVGSPYYWVVLPARELDGDTAQDIVDSARRQFRKQTPGPRTAMNTDALGQPRFSWTAQHGAREYRVQVAQDASFGKLVEDTVTSATSFTPSSTYPADAELYWRVRGNDEEKKGLAWSAVAAFRRQLPTPAPLAGNPTSGETIPALRWSPVNGAVSYDMHVDQADGTKKDFTVRSTAFTPTAFYGTGVWNWQVRANFPNGRSRSVAGGYSAMTRFMRHIATPRGLKQTAAKGRVVFSWEPAVMAKAYRVQVSDSSSFSRVYETVTTDNTSYAPKLDRPPYTGGGQVYWRVAAEDEGKNLGGFATNIFHRTRPLSVSAEGRLRRGRKSALKVTVKSGRSTLAGTTVELAGAGVKVKKKTNRKGVAVFKVRPTTKGKLAVRAVRKGYATATRSLSVR